MCPLQQLQPLQRERSELLQRERSQPCNVSAANFCNVSGANFCNRRAAPLLHHRDQDLHPPIRGQVTLGNAVGDRIIKAFATNGNLAW